MDYKGKGKASSNKRTRSEYEVDDHENLTNPGPYFIQHGIPDDEPLDSVTNYGNEEMAIDPALLETSKDPMTSQFAMPLDKPSESDKPVGRERRKTASQVKMEELVRAGRILANDELKWKDDYQIKCKIIVQSTTTARYLNLTVTYESLPVAGPSSGLSRNSDSELDIQNYPNVSGPSKIESLIFEHVGVVPKGPKKRMPWSNFSVIRDGEDLGTLTDIRVQLVKDLTSGDKAGQDAGEGSRKRKGSPSLKRKKRGITSDMQDERDTLIDVSQRFYSLVREMQQHFDDEGQALVDEQMMEIKKVADGKSQLWGKIKERKEAEGAEIEDA